MSPPAPAARLLVVDDDPALVDWLVEELREAGHHVESTVLARDALDRVRSAELDLVIADVEMPELRGIDLLSAISRERPGQLVLLITAFGSIDLAVQAMRAGACDFVTKPFRIEVLLHAVSRSLREREMRREIVRLRARVPDAGPGALVARDPRMQEVVDLARRAAPSRAPVLVTGESGSGKGAVARFLHEQGGPTGRPFVQLNCAALPEALLESELFGVRRGAFTGAHEDRPGLFLQATGGTILLDEIAELPPGAQAKLLQVLETGRVRPLGAGREVRVDARIVAATNVPLEEALRERRFRADLYYRLNVIRIELPPLRARPQDILALADAFLERACAREGKKLAGISAGARRRLLAYPWPGNVRELANAVDRAVALCEHDTLVDEDFAAAVGAAVPGGELDAATARGLPLAQVELAYIRRVLEAHGGNKARAARALGIDRRTLYRKVGAPEGDADEP